MVILGRAMGSYRLWVGTPKSQRASQGSRCRFAGRFRQSGSVELGRSLQVVVPLPQDRRRHLGRIDRLIDRSAGLALGHPLASFAEAAVAGYQES